MKKKPRI